MLTGGQMPSNGVVPDQKQAAVPGVQIVEKQAAQQTIVPEQAPVANGPAPTVRVSRSKN